MPSTAETRNNGNAKTGPQSALPGGPGFASGTGSMPGFGLCRPGDLKLWREIGQNPTVALGDAVIRGPIARCKWSWQKKDDCPEDRLKAIKDMFAPIWAHLIRDALDAIGMGCSPFEIVYGRQGKFGNAIVEMKSLGLDGDPWSTAKTTIIADAHGKFTGLENVAGEMKVRLPEANAWIYTHNGLKGNIKGHSRYENIRRDYCRAEELTEEFAKYLKKVASIIFQLHYPDGTSKDASGVDKPNYWLAEDLIHKVQSGHSVALQNKFAGFLAGDNGMVTPAVLEKALAAAGKSDWMFSFLQPSGADSSKGFLDVLAYYDKRFFRGLLRPERSGLEATKGGIGQSDAGDHGDVGLNDGEQVAWDLSESINGGVIDKALVANWGEGARGSVWCEPGPLLDTKAGKLAALLTTALGNPQIGPPLWANVDQRALLEDVEVPILAAVTPGGVVAIPPAVAAAAAKPEPPIKIDGPPAPSPAAGNAAVKRLSQAAVRQAGRELERHLSQEGDRERALLEMSKAGGDKKELTGGHWLTLHGAHVYVHDETGVVMAGSPHLIGRTTAQVEAHGKSPEKKHEGFSPIERNAKGDYVGTAGAGGKVEHNPEHAARLAKLKIAPGYTNVHLSDDPQSRMQARQTDAKGRETRVYSAEHHEKQAAAKFARVKKLIAKLPQIREAIKDHPSEEAAVLRLVDNTGLRIGSDANTGADKQAYGASTLRAEHVVNEGGKTRLKFTGKKGVSIDQEIADQKLAAELNDRAKSGGRLFNTNDAKVRDHLHSITPEFKVKDLRTAVAADTALNAMKNIPVPENGAEFVKSRKAVGDQVAAKLGNTGAVALKSYIPPEVFAKWEIQAVNREQSQKIKDYANSQGIGLDAAAKQWIPAHAIEFRNQFNKKIGRAKPGVQKMSQADEGGGHWIQIGAEPGPPDGKNHGGSPVYVKGGVIAKGNDKFIGKKLGDVGSEHHREFHKALVHVAERAKESHARGVDAHRAAHQAVSNVSPEHLKKSLGEHAPHLAESLDADHRVSAEEHAVHARVGRQDEQRSEPASHAIAGRDTEKAPAEAPRNARGLVARVGEHAKAAVAHARDAEAHRRAGDGAAAQDSRDQSAIEHAKAVKAHAELPQHRASTDDAEYAKLKADSQQHVASMHTGYAEARKEPVAKSENRSTTNDGGSNAAGRVGSDRTPETTGGPVAGADGGAGHAAADPGGDDPNRSAGDGPAKAVPAELGKVNARIDRFSHFFHAKGQHEVAGWLGKLKDHVNAVGVENAMDALGEAKGAGNDVTQYQGVKDIGDFAEKYLNRAGIAIVGDDAEDADPNQRVISAQSPSEGGFTRKRKGDFFPIDPKAAKDKLKEAQSLPGLEKSEALDNVTHLTPEVTKGLDEKYGKGKWIVKAYGDEAAAGYGIFFPQRAEQIQRDAQSTIHSAGAELAKDGFHLDRDKSGKVVGIQHENGDKYRFGKPDDSGNPTDHKYTGTIYGHAREWADKAARAANDENGAALPGGGKEFMAQPAFNVVGVSEADRAAGRTIAPGEGRVHVITRNGKAEVVPHSTWIKGDHLPVVFESEDTKAMAKAAEDAINHLPESDRRGQIYAPDVVKTDQGYKVVEANPTNTSGGSGYLTDNPMIVDSYVSHLTNRDPAHVRFIRKLLEKR